MSKASASGGAVLPTLLLLATCAPGGPPATEPVSIDLTRTSLCRVAGGDEAPKVVEVDALRRLQQPDARPIECFLRLPAAASSLVFRLPPDIPPEVASLSVSGAGRESRPRPEPDPMGALRADLGGFDGQLVELRLDNRSGEALEWIQPRVEGRDAPRAPLLERGAAPGERRPNLLLYVVDALRADRLSLYGYSRPTSPRLEALAERAVVFDAAYSTGPNTRNSLPSLLASLPPGELRGSLRRDRAEHVLPELFQAAGYRTAGFQANYWLRRSLGFARGFDTYRVLRREDGGKMPAAELQARALEWLSSAEEPFFLYIQSLDVHNPYEPPAPFLGRFAGAPIVPAPELPDLGLFGLGKGWRDNLAEIRADLHPERYDDAVAYADHEIGELLDALAERGLDRDTIVVVTADHGESLGEDGRWLHGMSLHEEQVHVPLLIALPGMRSGERRGQPVSLLDLAPTLLDLAKLATPLQFRGRSWLAPDSAAAPRAALGHARQGWFVREGEWKLITTGEESWLLHLPSDPQESRDLSAAQPVRTAYLERLLWAHAPGFRERDRGEPFDPGIDAEAQRQLREDLRDLGYVE